ncbi:MAG: CRISPR-associated protein Csm4, partial [Duodenibacillus sp.]|nr:CRISPR-associated protein Csm4 [Duodenibacillus sp.]
MARYRFTIRPLTAMGSVLLGETLFGQLCWALREREGEAGLSRCLAGYDKGEPFLVVSDALPHDRVPLPCLPQSFWAEDAADRKSLKARKWIRPGVIASQPPRQWRREAEADKDAFSGKVQRAVQQHVSINRMTGTSGEGGFAPFQSPETFYGPDVRLDIWTVIDEKVIGAEAVGQLLADVGAVG